MAAAIEEVERFGARSPDRVYETVLIVERELVPASTRREPGAVARGMKFARTVEGFDAAPAGASEFVVDHPTRGHIIVRPVREEPSGAGDVERGAGRGPSSPPRTAGGGGRPVRSTPEGTRPIRPPRAPRGHGRRPRPGGRRPG